MDALIADMKVCQDYDNWVWALEEKGIPGVKMEPEAITKAINTFVDPSWVPVISHRIQALREADQWCMALITFRRDPDIALWVTSLESCGVNCGETREEVEAEIRSLRESLLSQLLSFVEGNKSALKALEEEDKQEGRVIEVPMPLEHQRFVALVERLDTLTKTQLEGFAKIEEKLDLILRRQKS